MRLISLCKKLFVGTSLCFLSAICFAQTAYLQPAEINDGDTTKLIIEIEGGTPSLHGLDTSALEKDFEILGTSSGVQSVRDKSTLTYKAHWEIELFPLRTGKLEIPALNVNGRATERLILNVKKATDFGQGSTQNVFIQISAEPENPYIGQQVNVTVRLFHSVRIVNGTLSEPEAATVDVYRVGNDISYKREINNKQYNVLERSFAMFANSTEPLQIFPVSFRGQIEDQADDSSSAFSSFMRQIRQIKRTSNEISLNIREIPDSFTGKYWLPANDLRISEQWSDQGIELQVGDSISRDIKLIVDGLPAESLPEDIMDSNNNNLNVYPDKVSRHNQDIGKKLVGRTEQKYALIMSNAGYLDLPELKLKWWDVDEDVEKEAILPAKTLIVNADATQPVVTQEIPAQNAQAAVTGISPLSAKPQTNYWLWMALLFLVLWIITLFAWMRSRMNGAEISEDPLKSNWNSKALEQACHSNNPIQTRNQLIAWARDVWPQEKTTGLYQLKAKIQNQELITELENLDAVLYSNEKSEWSGETLLKAFSDTQTNINNTQKSAQDIIPPLYAQQS